MIVGLKWKARRDSFRRHVRHRSRHRQGGPGAGAPPSWSNRAAVNGSKAPSPRCRAEAEGEVVDLADESHRCAGSSSASAPSDHLVYSAGETLYLEALYEMQIDEARGFVNLRFWGAFTAVKYGGPHIRPGGSVTLINGAAGLVAAQRLDCGRERLQ